MFEWQKVIIRNTRKIKLLILEQSEPQKFIYDGLLNSVADYFSWKITDNITEINSEKEICEYDVVIVDLHLKYSENKTGVELQDDLKEYDKEKSIKFITSQESSDLKKMIRDNEMKNHIWKPINVEEFFNEISISI
ncbi:MAG: hypothetical protein R3B93_01415 [Bacteroidia bacterium]